jgi:hypothetical protein
MKWSPSLSMLQQLYPLFLACSQSSSRNRKPGDRVLLIQERSPNSIHGIVSVGGTQEYGFVQLIDRLVADADLLRTSLPLIR